MANSSPIKITAISDSDPLPKKLAVEMDELSAWVTKTRVRSNASYLEACEALKTFQTMRKEIRKHFKKYKDHLNAHRKMLMADEREHLDRIGPAEERLQKLILTFQDKREAKAQQAIEAVREASDPEAVLPASLVAVDPRGQYRREYNRVVVTDLLALVKAVAEGTVSIQALQPNAAYLNQCLAAQGPTLFKVPGVSVEQYSKVVTR
mgnify:CR=1 FL=1